MAASNSSAEIKITEEISANVGHQTGLADQTKQLLEVATESHNPDGLSGMNIDVFRAAEKGDIDALRRHKDDLHQILTVTNNTVVHIYIACAKTTNILEEILELCPTLLLQKNESGDTPLHIAARHGRDDKVKALINSAKARHGDLEEGVLLAEASWQKMLIRTTNKEKSTALHEAVRFNRLKVVEILTREDPEFLYSADDYGETPLYMAVERQYRDSAFKLSKMIKRSLTKARDETGRTPLHIAAEFYGTSIVKKLLEYDRSAAYARTNEEKRTPLHFAALKGNLRVMKELISQCPDCCELVDHRGQNILHYTTEHSFHRDLMKFVQNDQWLSTVLLNAKDADGNTPLHQIAASESHHLHNDFIRDDRIDKMAFNRENMTALDILDRHSAFTVAAKGKFKDLLLTGARTHCRISKPRNYVDDKKSSETEEKDDNHFVVATLIATVSFAAGLTMPGGYHDKESVQGFAILTKNAAFKTFVITNTIAMTLSSGSVLMHIYCRKNTKLGLQENLNAHEVILSLTMFALIAMMVAFITGTYAVLGNSSGLAITTCVLSCFFFFGLNQAVVSFKEIILQGLGLLFISLGSRFIEHLTECVNR